MSCWATRGRWIRRSASPWRSGSGAWGWRRTLLRLKELETLEKVTEKIDKLTVYGGLEGVLKDVVRISLPEA